MATFPIILLVVGLFWCGADFCRREWRHAMCPCGPIMCQQLCGRCYNVSSHYDVTKLECRCEQSAHLTDGECRNFSQTIISKECQKQDNCPCPFKFDRAANFCYYLELRLEKSTDMAAARLMCEKMAARSRLAVVNTHLKMEVIRTIVGKLNKKRRLWTGASRDKNGRFERWSDGSPILTSLWNPKEPNNCEGKEDCVIVEEVLHHYGINDAPCLMQCNYICDVPL